MTKEQKHVLQSAIDLFGTEKQLEMVVEECSELILAIQKYKRSKNDPRILFEMVQQGAADVEILIKQLRLMFGDKNIDYWIWLKIDRLESRIKQNNFEAK